MDANPTVDVTGLLLDWGKGDRAALDALTPFVYDELRRLARQQFRSERPGHTLQPTALVHDVYMRLVDQRRISWKNRAQFFAVAAQLIRRLLVDHARSRHRLKRGGDAIKVSWTEQVGAKASKDDGFDLLALEDVLGKLGEMDSQQGSIVELRFFGGLSIEETAEALKISPATVKREWAFARAWLYRELTSK